MDQPLFIFEKLIIISFSTFNTGFFEIKYKHFFPMPVKLFLKTNQS